MMKKLIGSALIVCLGITFVGCEWEGGGDGNSWNSRYNFVNVSGNYRGAGGGGYLVSQYSTAPVADTGDGSSGETTVPVTGETDGTALADKWVFNGKLNNVPVKKGSATIIFGSVADSIGEFRDQGDGTLKGNYSLGASQLYQASGTIDYDTGVWTLVLNKDYPLSVSQPILVNYAYVVASGAAPVEDTSKPGSSKVSIYAFNVQQEGNKVKIVDNNGSTYSGSIGSIRTTSGVDQDSTYPAYADGDQVIATFEASGRSAANVSVKIVGTFQSTISGVSSGSDGSTTSMVLGDRRILGTWIENNGKTGDINGQAMPISTTTSSATSTNSP